MLSLLPFPICAAEGWRKLAPLPDAVGFAAPFAGVCEDVLIVYGGANFPGKPPWQGGTKVWHDQTFILPQADADWIKGPRLPQAAAYGVSISTRDGLICIGGSDAARHLREVTLLQWRDGRMGHEKLPPLPRPCANACGARVGNTLYIAGGLEHPQDTQAMKTFWSLDLEATQPAWTELEPWPGPARMLATAATAGSAFYLFGGADLKADAQGKPERAWLRDAYRYEPGKGWEKLADLPRPAVAAPSPAPVLEDGRLAILGGDDGSQLQATPETHPGFPREPLLYDPQINQWQTGEPMPFSLVTTSVVRWGGFHVIPGGEARPGVRSTEIWALPVAAASDPTP